MKITILSFGLVCMMSTGLAFATTDTATQTEGASSRVWHVNDPDNSHERETYTVKCSAGEPNTSSTVVWHKNDPHNNHEKEDPYKNKACQ